jgi:hypothetical protein
LKKIASKTLLDILRKLITLQLLNNKESSIESIKWV